MKNIFAFILLFVIIQSCSPKMAPKVTMNETPIKEVVVEEKEEEEEEEENKFQPKGDWAHLNKFRQQNQVLDMSATENRIVFMGNSITEGWLQDELTLFDKPNHINRGISGQTTPQMLIRFRPDVVDLKPKAVVILAGINDIAGNTGPMTIDETANNIKSMAEIADASNIKVVISSVLPAYDFPWNPGLNPADKVLKLNAILKTYCIEKNFTYLDYHTPMKDDRNGLPPNLSYDEVHATIEGYKMMEGLLQNVLDNL